MPDTASYTLERRRSEASAIATSLLAVLLLTGCSDGPDSTTDRLRSANGASSTFVAPQAPPAADEALVVYAGDTDVSVREEPRAATDRISLTSEADEQLLAVGDKEIVTSGEDACFRNTIINDSLDPDTAERRYTECLAARRSTNSVRIEWSGATSGDLGYYVYYGSTPEEVSQLASRIEIGQNDGAVQTATLHAGDDLSLGPKQSVCFSIAAWTTYGDTARSDVECVRLTL